MIVQLFMFIVLTGALAAEPGTEDTSGDPCHKLWCLPHTRCEMVTVYPTCVDIDECQTQNVCPANSTCLNYLEGYNCECQSGYRMKRPSGEKYGYTNSSCEAFVESVQYTYIAHDAAWDEAKKSCKNCGMRLAAPRDEVELTKLVQFADENLLSHGNPDALEWRAWTGYREDKKALTTTKGENVNINESFWHTNEPNSDDEKCVEIRKPGRQGSPRMNDLDCSAKIQFICEK